VSISSASILAALKREREANQRGLALDVIESSEEDGYYLLTVRPQKGHRATVDERLEASRVKWGDEFDSAGRVKVVDVDNDRLVIDPARGERPSKGDTIWVFPNDFFTPLIELWEGEDTAIVRKRLAQSHDSTPIQTVQPLPVEFHELRNRQKLAVQAAHHRCSLLVGPPGTGKTHTIGAMASYLLARFPKARIILVGPTNVAVDTALL
jgi:SpoVK/Ycf46/Vps4 family AAA+-type ATPase